MDKHYKKGREYLNQNQIDKAIEEFNKSLKISDRLFATYEELGNCYNQKKEFNKAVEYYELAIQDAKGLQSYNLFFNRALALKKLGRYEEAIKDLKSTLEIVPTQSNAWTLMSNCYRAMGEYEDAINSLDKALALEPKYLLALKNQASLYAISGNEEKAQEVINKIFTIEPTDFQSWTIKGDKYIELGNFNEARNCYNLAMNLSGGHPYAYQMNDRFKRIYAQYQEIRKQLPTNADEWNIRGVKLFSLQIYIEALGCFEKAISLSPKKDFFLNKAHTYSMLERYEKALNTIDDLIKSIPNDADIWNHKGDLFFKKEDYTNALSCYDKAIKLDPKLQVAQDNKKKTISKIRN